MSPCTGLRSNHLVSFSLSRGNLALLVENLPTRFAANRLDESFLVVFSVERRASTRKLVKYGVELRFHLSGAVCKGCSFSGASPSGTRFPWQSAKLQCVAHASTTSKIFP